MKKLATMAISIGLIGTMVAGGSLAYLQDSDSDVNVMTLGKVEIEQLEYERVVENGAWVSTGETDKYGYTPDKVQEFTQAKPLYPAVFANGAIDWDDRVNGHQQSWGQVGASGSNQLFDNSVKNVQDKFVFVKNTGKSDAYVRTLIAFEQGSFEANSKTDFDKVIMSNRNESQWSFDNWLFNVEIDGNKYVVVEAVYTGPSSNPTGILTPGAVSYPSLLQVYMRPEAGNKEVDAIDGNGNGTYDILVLSQAVQTAGFENAEAALKAGFGEANAENVAKWFGGIKVINYEHVVSDLDGLKAAFAEGGNILLEDDIKFEKITTIEPGKEVYLNLNGKTITVDEDTTSNTLLYVKDGAKLTIDGNGTINLGEVSTMAIFAPYGELVIENGTFIRDKVTTVTDKTTGLFMGAKVTASNVTINGGYFDPGYYDANAADIEGILAGTKEFTETADDIAKRGNSKDANLVRVALKDNVSVILNHSGCGSFKIYGGTFVGANPAWGDEGCMLPTKPNYLRPWSYYQGALLDGQTFHEDRIVLPDGYSITQGTTAEGIPTYTVNYNSK